MGQLHITKVAVGCASVEVLSERLLARASGGETTVTTRYKPKRAEELIGGSLYWIIKHRLVIRQRILGFAETEGTDGPKRCVIRVEDRLIPVRARPKRAHQGWRYLEAKDAPSDHDGGEDDLAALPPALVDRLAALALI